MNEGRCDERLKVRVKESACLTYTGFVCVYYETIKRKPKIRCI
jgi:hypothetical protein